MQVALELAHKVPFWRDSPRAFLSVEGRLSDSPTRGYRHVHGILTAVVDLGHALQARATRSGVVDVVAGFLGGGRRS